MTETVTVVSMMSIKEKIGTGSVGFLLPGITARVVKQDGSFGGVGEPGELIVTGPSMALGYTNNEEATKETFVDGWVRTGDEVVFDKNGEMTVVDRLKELIKVKGFQVAPAELEGHLLDHPLVADVCVVPVPDDYSGEVPLAFVVLSAEAEQKAKDRRAAQEIKAELMKFVADNKIKYKHLSDVQFIQAIPKNPSGKLLRRVLRDMARNQVKERESAVKSKL